MSERPENDERSGELSLERTAAFLDAVVAIALTLLILPLMDSVTDLTGDDAMTASEWFAAHTTQLQSFVTSFVLILLFWVIHHQLFRHVRTVTRPLVWMLGAWLLTIVWLPVASALSGVTHDDTVARGVYIGSLMLVAIVSLGIRLYLRAHPALIDESDHDIMWNIAVDASMIILFGVALVLAVVFPAVGYWSLLVMLGTGVVQRLLRRMFR